MNALQFAQPMGALSAPPQMQLLPPGMDFKRLAENLNLHAREIDARMKDICVLATQIRVVCRSLKASASNSGASEIAVLETFADCCIGTAEHIDRNNAGIFRAWHELRKLPGARA